MFGRLACVVGLLALLVTSPAGQENTAREMAARLRDYLGAYEQQIGAVVAEEDMRQSMFVRPAPAHRQLVSDVAFLRLPGDLNWLAHRAVNTVDGKAVGAGRQQLLNLLKQSGVDAVAIARAMVDESASYNLGRDRTVNVPTLPMDLLHARHARHFEVEWRGEGRRNRRPAVRLLFRESAPGALVRTRSGYARTEVDAWIDRESAALLEATVDAFQPGDSAYVTRVRIVFAHDAAVDMLVPVRMEEWFRPEGRGRATYRNYRRFETTARILPPGR